MLREEKIKLTSIGKIERYSTLIQKITIDSQLGFKEKSHILAVAIIFLKHYEKDSRFTSYADFAYFIILKYALKYDDYEPLYDFAVNFGFFPIVKALIGKELYNQNQLENYIIGQRLDEFRHATNYTETLEQNLESNRFLQDVTNEKSYLAPTSFGKSSLIIDYLKRTSSSLEKIGIIVPTKSLLMQTYQMIRNANLGKRIIIHDEMYNDEDDFIAVFTQERALRLMNRKQLAFDVLIIDEAHNMLKYDSGKRQVLLTRLIAKNLRSNPKQKVVYLSPLIENPENLKISKDQKIGSHKIKFNIKEPDIFEFTIDHEKFQYNRFVNQFYPIETKAKNKYEYILSNYKSKNFLYENSPLQIEKTAEEFTKYLTVINSDTFINEVIDVLKVEVHKDFYAIKYLNYGIIYLHGKLPDLIKEYLEAKFREISSIPFLIANSVILEGINLPFEALFILNTHRLQGKELINLIGRVNRLNNIFVSNDINLQKLLPKVHFINRDSFSDGHNGKIRLLRSRVFDDNIENPLLSGFDDTQLDSHKKSEIDLLKENEKFLFSEAIDAVSQLKQYLIESGINYYYSDLDTFTKTFLVNKEKITDGTEIYWNSLNMLEKVNYLFIKDQLILDFEIDRLGNESAQRYYTNYIYNSRKLAFNQRVVSHVQYFDENAKSLDPNRNKLYIGPTYGEEKFNESDESSMRTYVNLKVKSSTERVNLAIVKLKMEDDFISFKLNKFIVMMYDFDLISINEYNLFIYGTEDERKIALTKTGLTISLISKLENDGQLSNISFDEFNNLTSNNTFKTYLQTINDLNRYEMNKYIQ